MEAMAIYYTDFFKNSSKQSMHYKHQNIWAKWCNYSTMVSTLDNLLTSTMHYKREDGTEEGEGG